MKYGNFNLKLGLMTPGLVDIILSTADILTEDIELYRNIELFTKQSEKVPRSHNYDVVDSW